MPNVTLLRNGFVGGEISPLLEGRVDLPAYQFGCRTLTNFIPMRQGGIRRRPGTYYHGTTLSNGAARIEPFTALDGSAYVFEFTDTKLRIWDSAAFALEETGGSPVELTTPYVEAKLFEFKYAVMKGVMWIVHPDYAPRTVSYSGGTWSIATPTFSGDRTFSSAGNYPKAIAFGSGRLFLAATNNEPNAIFGSQAPTSVSGTDQFTNFSMGTTVGSAVYLQESDMNGTHIHWMLFHRRMVVATDRTQWMDSGVIITPDTFDLNCVGYVGSAEMQGRLIEDIVVYAGRGGTSIHAMAFSEEGGGYQDFDLTANANHMLASGIVQIAVQTFPEPILWVVCGDGTVATCTLNFKEGIIAWSRHEMGGDGLVESVAIVPCELYDTIWFVVNRGGTRTMEHMRFCDLLADDVMDQHFVDCGLDITNDPASATVSGLSHLEGEEVDAMGDGAILPQKTVESGEVEYDREITRIHIGLPYVSTAIPTRPEVPANGTSQNKIKRVEEVTLRLYASLGGSAGQDEAHLQAIKYKTMGSYTFGSAEDPFTGDYKLQILGAVDPGGTFVVQQADPAPFTLLAAFVKIALQEA